MGEDEIRAEAGDAAGPPRSSTAAVLLALTGIGLGYAYLRRWWRAVLQVAGAVLLGALAAATDAADLPWLWCTVAAVWSVAGAVDAWRLARRTAPVAAGRVPVAVGALVTSALVAGFLGYGAAGRATYDDGLAALARGDCAAATDRLDVVDGVYELTLSGAVPQSRVFRDQCAAFLAAAGAHERAEHEVAFRGYEEARALAPDSPLAPFLHEGIVRSLTERAATERAAGNYPEAVDRYHELLGEEVRTGNRADIAAVREEIAATHLEQADAARQQVLAGSGPPAVRTAGTALLTITNEFDDTATASRVPQAFADLYAAAVNGMADGRFCDVVPLIEEFLDLPQQAIADQLARARADHPEAMLQCAVQRFQAGEYSAVIEPLERLVSTYPDAPQVPQARSAIIAATVGDGTPGGSVVLPAPLDGDSPGRNPVTFYNASPHELRVLVAGPTAHEVTLPPCADCPAEYARDEDACVSFDGLPSATLRLGPGEFDLLGIPTDDSSVDSLTDTVVVQQGYLYTNCLYVKPDPVDDTYPFPQFELPEIPLPRLEDLVPLDPPR